MSFLIAEQFKLELHWKKPLYEVEGECMLEGAYFTGPALQIAQKINTNDYLMLDLYSQYIALVKGAYVLKLSWGDVVYSDDGLKVFLNNAKLVHDKDLNNAPSLGNSDYFVIDTADHTSELHPHNLVYRTLVVNENHIQYRFNK